MLRRPVETTAGIGQFAAIQAVAPSFGVELTPIDVRDPSEMERGVSEFARRTNGGLIAPASPSSAIHRELIIALAARHRLPAVYPWRYMVTGGGLMSYGIVDQFRQAAGYVDRILRGEKAGDVGPYCSANPFRARRRGDRIVAAMSASGTKLPIRDIRCYGMDSEVVEKLSLTVWRLEEIVHASSFADQRDRVGSLA